MPYHQQASYFLCLSLKRGDIFSSLLNLTVSERLKNLVWIIRVVISSKSLSWTRMKA